MGRRVFRNYYKGHINKTKGEGGSKGGRKRGRETSMRGCLSHDPPTGDLICNPGMCPDGESNWQPFGSQGNTQSTEPHQPGAQYWKTL